MMLYMVAVVMISYGEAGDDHLHHDGSGHTVFDGGEGIDTVHQDLSNVNLNGKPTIVIT